MTFISEIAALKEDGMIASFFDYWNLPEPVYTAWRIYAAERSKKIERDRDDAKAKAKRR